MLDNLCKNRHIMDIINVKQLDKDNILYLVNSLEDFEKDKAIRAGLYAGGSVLKRGGVLRLKLRMKSPLGRKGNLIKAFSVRVKKSKLGVLSGFGYPEGRHSWLLDKGTGLRHTKSYGYRGYGPALRYWEDTRSQDGTEAIEAIRDGIERAVKRINNRKT